MEDRGILNEPDSARPEHMQALEDETLARVADAFNLGAITDHWPATHGIENRNFFLATVREGVCGEYVLTIVQQPANSHAALTQLLGACAGAGLPVAAPRGLRDGVAELTIDGRPTLLCPRLGGRHAVNPTPAQVCSIGRFLGRLHRDTTSIAPALPAYPRTVEWLRERAADCVNHVPYPSQWLMRETLDEVAQLLGRADVAALPAGTIHGDLFRDNALFNRWGLSGVLDFHHAARGAFVYDLAVAANDWCVDPDGQIDPQRLAQLLRGYHTIRQLHRQEVWLLPMFMLYAGLAFWLSRLSIALELRRGRADRANDPLVFERIVAARRDGQAAIDSWYIDQSVAASDR